VTGPTFEVRPLTRAERPRLVELLTRSWGSPQIVTRGRLHNASRCPALGCFDGERLLGLATYELADSDCELLTLEAFEKGRTIGSRLLAAVAERARAAGCRRLWLVTTNDNAPAARFYERRGMRLAAVHHGAVDAARRLKPEIPEVGCGGVRISDELEFELEL
jgi:GNAT superfamily N-acetyltransferase